MASIPPPSPPPPPPPPPHPTNVAANFNDNSFPNHPLAPPNDNHPSYAEMIYTAIGALKKKKGSSKRAISKYMEQVYKDHLPPNHATLLTQNLKSLKKNGLLVLVKKSYHLPQPQNNAAGDDDALPIVPADSVVSSGSSRPRGRPRKNAVTASASDSSAAAAAVARGGKKLAVAGKKPMKKSTGRPVGRPKGSTAAVKVAQKVANLRRKLQYFQSKVRESVTVLRTYFNGESPITARAAIHELESLASLNINLPLREESPPPPPQPMIFEEPYRPQIQFHTQLQNIFHPHT